jgi:hypothetical protein
LDLCRSHQRPFDVVPEAVFWEAMFNRSVFGEDYVNLDDKKLVVDSLSGFVAIIPAVFQLVSALSNEVVRGTRCKSGTAPQRC